MLNFWKKKKNTNEDGANGDEATPQAGSGTLTWNAQASQALDQAVAQSPVPGMLKGRLKKELSKAAEAETTKAGRTEVTAEDLMTGLMSKLPAHMRSQIEEAAKQGPEGLKNLEKKLKRK